MLYPPSRWLKRRRTAAPFRPSLELLESRDLLSIFGSPTSFPAGGTGPTAVVTGDFDKDGKTDLAVLNAGTNTVNIFSGNGIGNFTPTSSTSIGSTNNTPKLLAVGDIDGDGNLDVIVGNTTGTPGLQILLGNGTGGFKPAAMQPPAIPLPAVPVGLALGQFNSTVDNQLDIAVTVAGHGLLVFFSKTGGGFSPPTPISSTGSLAALATGDLDRDGKTDLVVTDASANTVRPVYFNGDNTFTLGTPVAVAVGTPASVAIGDFNGDGKPDVATADASPGADNAAIFFGSGSRAALTPGPALSIGANPTSIVAQDFNGDNVADLAVAVTGGLQVFTGGASFSTDATYSLGADPAALAVGTFSADPRADLVAVNPGNATVSVLLHDAVSGFHVTAPTNATAGAPFSITVTAVDAGGHPVTNYTGTVHFSSGDPGASLPLDYTFTATDAGVHTFNNVTLFQAGASGVSISDGSSNGGAMIAVSPAAADHLRIVGMIPDATAGAPMSTVTVQVLDAYNNLETSDTSTVTLALAAPVPPGGVLNGMLSAPVSGGVATFAGLGIDVAANGYRLAASDGSLIGDTSNPFNVNAGAVSHFAIMAPPTTGAGGDFDGMVTALDAQNNIVANYTGTVTLTSSDLGATLPGSYTFTATDAGRHLFTGINQIVLVTAGSQSLGVTDGTVSGSALVLVQAGPPSQLAFVVQPADAATGQSLGAVEVQVLDAYGNQTNDSQTRLTMSLVSISGNGTLNGSLRQQVAAGDSVFNALSISRPGTYELTVAAPGFADVLSTSVTITALTESEPNDNPATANYLGDNSTLVGALPNTASNSDTDVFQLNLLNQEEVTIHVTAGGAPIHLALLNAAGTMMIESAGISSTDADAEIVQVLPAGTWFVQVDSPATTTTNYTITTTGIAAMPPGQPLAPVVNPGNLITGDFNGDGIMDLAAVSADPTQGTANVYLGLGDGVFQPPSPHPVAGNPVAVGTGDFDKDGDLDLAVLSQSPGGDVVSILTNRGDGVFFPGASYTLTGQTGGDALVVADFNGDGYLDVAVAHQSSESVTILLNDGSGGLVAQPTLYLTLNLTLFAPTSLAVGDFDGNHSTDLAVTTADFGGAVVLLSNDGSGSFTVQGPANAVGQLQAGVTTSNPTSIVAADFNGDGFTDIATANNGSRDVSVLLGNGDGTFQPQVAYSAGTAPTSLGVGDINADGLTDLVAGNVVSNVADVLQNKGGGTFTLAQSIAVGGGPISVVIADFNGDGRADVATVNGGTNDITTKIQRADGTFQTPSLRVGGSPTALLSADLNNDGALDTVTLNSATSNISVLLGDGQGAVSSRTDYTVADNPVAFVSGDFNGDGRTDIAVISQQNDATSLNATATLSILLGLGDGTFQTALTTTFAHWDVTGLAAGDFNGDGHTDLALAYELDASNAVQAGQVTILNGLGGGAFGTGATYNLPSGLPVRIITSDFDANGKPDLLVLTGGASSFVTVMKNTGNAFSLTAKAVGSEARDLLSADLTGDGKVDLAVLNASPSAELTLLPGNGTGGFGTAQFTAIANVIDPSSFAAGDFTGDGHLDLAVTDYSTDRMYLLTYASISGGIVNYNQSTSYYATGDGPQATITGDFNNDRRTDVIVADRLIGDASIFLNVQNTSLNPAGQLAVSSQATPLVGDVNGDGLPDVVVLASDGSILFRPGVGTAGTFGAAQLVNGDPNNPGQVQTARTVQLVQTSSGVEIVAVNTQNDTLTIYTWKTNGGFTMKAGPFVGPLAMRLAATDLNGDGLTDLVATNASSQAEVLLQIPGGTFTALPALDVGFAPSAIQFVDRGTGFGPDIVITGLVSGDVSVLMNDATHSFSQVERYRAGDGPYDVIQSPQGDGMIRSQNETAGVVAGNFDGDSVPDLVTINPGTSSLALLSGTGSGAYFNPQDLSGINVGGATAIVSGAFDSAHPSVTYIAVLDTSDDLIHIYKPDGIGGFTEVLSLDENGLPSAPAAGNSPTGLTVADVDGDGNLDLLVGNTYGDILVLHGNGDGTFQSYQRTGRSVHLAAADLFGTGQDAFVLSNESADTLATQSSLSPSTGTTYPQLTQNRGDGILAPGAVKLADLNGDGILDLAAVNGGGNNVLVYLGLGGGQFGPATSYFVGTDPVGLTVADLNGDGLLDLVVANEGSNDVTILLGSNSASGWKLTLGPRLSAGAGPTATTVADVNGDGISDLLVTDSLTNQLRVLTGVGGGFFNDTSAPTFNTGSTPGQVFVGNFNGTAGLDVVVLNSGSSTLTFFSNFSTSSGSGTTISVGGSTPTAGMIGDFNHDGVTDLLIANNGSNTITLLEGSIAGLVATTTFTDPALADPTDLAMATSGLAFYVTEAGSDDIFVFNFPESSTSSTLDESGVAVVNLPVATTTSSVAELVPLSDTSFDSVVVLVSAPQTATVKPDPSLLDLQRSAEESLPFTSEPEVTGPAAANALILVEAAAEAEAGAGGGMDDSQDPPTEPVEADSAVPKKDGPALLRFLQNLDMPVAPPPETRPDQGNTDDQETGIFGPLGDETQRCWEICEPPATSTVAASVSEIPVTIVVSVAPAPAAEPEATAAPSGPQFSEEAAPATTVVVTEAAPTPATEQSGQVPVILAAPLLAAYFARERLIEKSRPRQGSWRFW